jgi:hypothetical protein
MKEPVMKTKYAVILIGLFTLALAVGVFAQDPPKKYTFSELCENLTLTKKTSLYVKTYWEKVRGQEVTWTGIVKNVKGGRGKATIYVANKAKPTYRGYNIILTTYDIEGAGTLEIGQRIQFQGMLNNYKGRKGSPVLIYLNDVSLL